MPSNTLFLKEYLTSCQGKFLEISQFYNLTVHPSWKIEPRIIKDDLLVMGKEGKGLYRVAKKEFHVSPGSISFIAAGLVHEAKITDPPFSLYSLRFRNPAPPEGGEAVFLKTNRPSAFDSLFRELQRYVSRNTNPFLKRHMSDQIIKTLLLKIYEEKHYPDPPEQREKLNRIRQHMESRPEDLPSFNELASLCGLSPPVFSRKYRENFGITVKKDMSCIRLNHGYHLLTESSLPVKEIARRLGYSDPFVFSRMIKKEYGLSPSFLRRKSQARIDKGDVIE